MYNLYWNDSPVADSPLEGMKRLKQFWNSVWQRPSPNLDDVFRVLDGLVSNLCRASQHWDSLTPRELAEASKALQGSSADIDGWSGDDIASLRECVWKEVAIIFDLFEFHCIVPSNWQQIRQVQIPKPGKGVGNSDQAVRADALRPVSVLSAWWRLWGRARLQLGWQGTRTPSLALSALPYLRETRYPCSALQLHG